VLEKSKVSAVFLTNDFDDPLERFDTQVYIPCLRTDDLVFHLAKPQVRERLVGCSGIGLDGSLSSLRDAIEQRFQHFVSHGARACAISLPPDFSPAPVSDGRASTALDAVLRQGVSVDPAHRTALARRIFWTIAELCDQYGLPFDLMIGVNREVYREGVYQGRDLYDSRVSLIQYAELFNAFPNVKFPVSVLASVTNQELVSYAWIFPNVVTSGHWWYSNTPTYIRRDAAARLEAVPRNKQIAYYSDAYKLEFIAPKFDMYRQTLADILTEDFVVQRRWSEEQAIELGYQLLRGNVEQIFPALETTQLNRPALPSSSLPASFAGVVSSATAADLLDASDQLDMDDVSELPDMDDVSELPDMDDAAEYADAAVLAEATEFVEAASESPEIHLDYDRSFTDEAFEEVAQPTGAMESNPMTGELTMPVPESDDEDLLATLEFDDDDDEMLKIVSTPSSDSDESGAIFETENVSSEISDWDSQDFDDQNLDDPDGDLSDSDAPEVPHFSSGQTDTLELDDAELFEPQAAEVEEEEEEECDEFATEFVTLVDEQEPVDSSAADIESLDFDLEDDPEKPHWQ